MGALFGTDTAIIRSGWAQLQHNAGLTIRRSGVADLHSQLDQPFVRMPLVFCRCDRVDRVGGFFSCCVLDDLEAPEHAQDMGIDGNAVFRKQVVHHQVCHLTADALKFEQTLAVGWDLAPVLLDNLSAHDFQVGSLAVVVRHRSDKVAQLFIVEGKELSERRDPRIERDASCTAASGRTRHSI